MTLNDEKLRAVIEEELAGRLSEYDDSYAVESIGTPCLIGPESPVRSGFFLLGSTDL